MLISSLLFRNLNRTIQTPAQVPVVVSPGNQHLHTVTLQTVPITIVIASADPSSAAGSQKFIYKPSPSSQPMTVLKETWCPVVQLGSPPPLSWALPTCSRSSPAVSRPSATEPSARLRHRPSVLPRPWWPFLITVHSCCSPPGTVITSVIKAQEAKNSHTGRSGKGGWR